MKENFPNFAISVKFIYDKITIHLLIGFGAMGGTITSDGPSRKGATTDLKTRLNLEDVPEEAMKLACKIAAKNLNDSRFDGNWQEVMEHGKKVALEIFAHFGVEGLQTINELGINGMDFSLLLLNLRLPDGRKLDLPGLYTYLKAKAPLDVVRMLRVIEGSSYYVVPMAGQDDEQTHGAAAETTADVEKYDDNDDHARNSWPY